MRRVVVLSLWLTATVWVTLVAQTAIVPRIWDDAALADWATPVAGLNIRPAHYSSAEYYSVPGDNLRTYPVYHPDSEPAGYWEELQKRKPEPVVDASTIRTQQNWIAAGERAFREVDSFWARSDDPALIAQARNPAAFEGVVKMPDGTALGPRWVVTSKGVMLTFPACSGCHLSVGVDGTVSVAGPRTPRPAGAPPLNPRGLGGSSSPRPLLNFFEGDTLSMVAWRMFTTPWRPDPRIEQFRDGTSPLLQPGSLAARDDGTFVRPHGSPFYATKIMDLQNLRYSRYLDATGTHRLRGPEDVARYAAFVTGADPMQFGPHRILSDAQRKVRYRYADEVLYAIGVYLMSLEPPRNPNVAHADVLARGQQVFGREGCVNCHVPPNYSSGKLTLAEGWLPLADHPNRDDIVHISVGTDPGLALQTRKGTGFYKVPSLRGVWYRPRLLHDGSLTSLEEMFDAGRLKPDYEPRGWNPRDVTRRPVPGHTFGLSLSSTDRADLLAFLRSL